MNLVIQAVFLVYAIWAIRRDTASRTGISGATWIPTLWIGIIASRPFSTWIGGGGTDTLEGSSLDRLFFFGLICAGVVVLARRSVNWRVVIAQNWAVLFFYGFLLVSVLWANSPFASLKRWTKEAGNIVIVLLILTEADPLHALRAVFARCAYVLIPLSLVFIRYFPGLGRQYNRYTGEMEATGVTFQKNSLGAMILTCTLVLFWDWLERRKTGEVRGWFMRLLPLVVFAIGAHLLWLSDSKTSLACLLLALAIVGAARLPVLHRRIRALGMYILTAVAAFFIADRWFGVTELIVKSMGRDMTFTGRTEVWHALLNIGIDPIFGTGFMSLWDDTHYRALLPEWVAYSAHNGYLEIFLAGGILGIGALAVMLLAAAVRINAALQRGEQYAVLRFAILVVALTANFTESNFACMTPIGLLFLLAAIGEAPTWKAVAVEPASARTRRAQFATARTRLQPQT